MFYSASRLNVTPVAIILNCKTLLNRSHVLASLTNTVFNKCWIDLTFSTCCYRSHRPACIEKVPVFHSLITDWNIMFSHVSLFLWTITRPATSYVLQHQCHHVIYVTSSKKGTTCLEWTCYRFSITLTGLHLKDIRIKMSECLVRKLCTS